MKAKSHQKNKAGKAKLLSGVPTKLERGAINSHIDRISGCTVFLP